MSNDHYVPQLYFRNFAPGRDGVPDSPERRSIRLINLVRRKYVPAASIKGQCKKAGFHDYQPGLEAGLGQLEDLAASAIRGVIEANVPPEPRSADHEALAVFTVIQQSRTLHRRGKFGQAVRSNVQGRLSIRSKAGRDRIVALSDQKRISSRNPFDDCRATRNRRDAAWSAGFYQRNTGGIHHER